ncbi:PTS sugar transporter subunit IIA [Bacillus sp. FJAT-22090]|uniref:PTS sugar transporter subunit IIA n=1 Tax=Bacillus sp. FJAT-22090 TaxID=1581038 RepID=UPI0011A0CA76|nr:PTS sugar transporter subunit IIA [Bacillus sp. FJAT-22090]
MNNIIEESAIRLNVVASDWEEAIRTCGEVLLETGKVERSYIDAMINTIKEFGPYILIAPGVALPHARPEDGVIKEGICVVLLKNEVAFELGKEMKVLIGLAARDKESHIGLLKRIAEVISEEETIELLKNAKKEEEIVKLFNRGRGD